VALEPPNELTPSFWPPPRPAHRVAGNQVELRLDRVAGQLDFCVVLRRTRREFRELRTEACCILQSCRQIDGGLVSPSGRRTASARRSTRIRGVIEHQLLQRVFGAGYRFVSGEEIAATAFEFGDRLRENPTRQPSALRSALSVSRRCSSASASVPRRVSRSRRAATRFQYACSTSDTVLQHLAGEHGARPIAVERRYAEGGAGRISMARFLSKGCCRSTPREVK
jgi:hypothetical protein